MFEKYFFIVYQGVNRGQRMFKCGFDRTNYFQKVT